jgi:hypothetical protein
VKKLVVGRRLVDSCLVVLLFQEISDFGSIEVGVDLMSPQCRDTGFGGPERQPLNPIRADTSP